jgi:hypothetical protein
MRRRRLSSARSMACSLSHARPTDQDSGRVRGTPVAGCVVTAAHDAQERAKGPNAGDVASAFRRRLRTRSAQGVRIARQSHRTLRTPHRSVHARVRRTRHARRRPTARSPPQRRGRRRARCRLVRTRVNVIAVVVAVVRRRRVPARCRAVGQRRQGVAMAVAVDVCVERVGARGPCVEGRPQPPIANRIATRIFASAGLCLGRPGPPTHAGTPGGFSPILDRATRSSASPSWFENCPAPDIRSMRVPDRARVTGRRRRADDRGAGTYSSALISEYRPVYLREGTPTTISATMLSEYGHAA